jgi:hypothetical protein
VKDQLTPLAPSLLVLGLLTATPVARAADGSPPPSAGSNIVFAAGVWTVAQLIPSPLLVVGPGHVGGGLRWQITPLVYSFGVAARPFRAFVIEPVARHSGGIELYGSPEWACCAPGGGTSWIARGGARVYLPLVGHGEALACSVGASYYRASGGAGAAFDVGAYALFGIVGVTVTVSPALASREVIGGLNLRYF